MEDGHALGMHTYSHYGHDRLTIEQKKEDMVKTQAAFKAVLGYSPDIFRPPMGRLSLAELIYCMKLSVRTVMWDVNPEDYKKEPQEVLRARVNGMRLQSGNIILFHDDMPATINVLPDIINKVREAGLSFGVIE